MGVLLTLVLMVVGAGVGVESERRRPKEAVALARKLLLVMLYVLVPPVIFFNLAASSISVDNAVGIGIALVNMALVGTVTWLVASKLLHLSPPKAGAVICAAIVANTTYLGYPLTVALLGRDHLSTGVLFDVLVGGPTLMFGAFGVGAAFGTKAGEGMGDRVRAFFTRNPPLYAAIAGLLAPSALAPAALVDISQALIVAILPIGFFAVGATLAENAEHGELPMPPPMTRPVALAIVTRLAVVPGLLMLLAAPLIDLPAAYRLLSAMPSGLNSLVIAHAYGLDMEITAEAVTWTTAIVVGASLIAALAF